MERELKYWAPGSTEATPIRVSFGTPETHPEYDWTCRITIEGFPHKPHYTRLMYGTDAVSAMAAALSVMPYLLRASYPRGGRLTWRDQEELGFPYMLSEPRQDWEFTPANGGEPRKLTVRVGHPEWVEETWTALVSCVDFANWKAEEKRVEGNTWPLTLERAAATATALLNEYVQGAGGGTLKEIKPDAAREADTSDPKVP